jgi:hypothetical protein
MFALAIGITGLTQPAAAQEDLPGDHRKDRGGGIPASMFATYIEPGQLLIFPFYAYSRDDNREYQPAALGFGLDEDFRGKFRSSEQQIFIGYGISDRLAIEFETGHIRASLDKSPGDPSATPTRIEESGLGDVEGQVRARLMREGESRPELFGYLEVTAPSQRHKLLIGEPDWDFKPGFGAVRGFSLGTLLIRTTGEYNRDNTHFDVGETAVEYLRRLSPRWRINLGVEGGETGAPDEWDLVSGVQWRSGDHLVLRFDNALGITSKATDWAPQIGLMVAIPR